jgi:hypothetical protein
MSNNKIQNFVLSIADNLSKITSVGIHHILDSLGKCNYDTIIYNCSVNIMNKLPDRHKHLKDNMSHVINSNSSLELMFLAIIMNDIAYVKLMLDNGYRYINSFMPRSHRKSKPLMYLAAIDNKPFIFKLFLQAGARTDIIVGKDIDLISAIVFKSDYKIIDIIIDYNLTCESCVYTLYRCTDNTHINNDTIKRLIYSLQIQKNISPNDNRVVYYYADRISKDIDIRLIKELMYIVCEKLELKYNIGFIVNKYTFPYYVKYNNPSNNFYMLRVLLTTNSILDIHHIVDYYFEHDTDIVKLIFFHVLKFDMKINDHNIMIDIVRKLVKIIDPKYLLKYEICDTTNKIKFDTLKLLIKRYDWNIIKLFNDYIPCLCDNLADYKSIIIQHKKLDILKQISIINIVNSTVDVSIVSEETKTVKLNKYALKAVRYEAWDIYEYIADKYNDNYSKYVDKIKSYDKIMALDNKLVTLIPDYCNERKAILNNIKYVALMFININEKQNTFKHTKYLVEIMNYFGSTEKAHTTFSKLQGIVLPIDFRLKNLFAIITNINNSYATDNNYNDETISKTIKNIHEKYMYIVTPHIYALKTLVHTINMALKQGIYKCLKNITNKYTIFEKNVTTNIIPIELDVSDLIKKLKYPTQLPHYSKLKEALLLNTNIITYTDKIVCTNNSITIIMYKTGDKYMNNIKHYACNIYSAGKDDIYHIYNFSVDKYLHTIPCRIITEPDRIFTDKITTKAYFNGQMIINNEIINGTYEYFTNCFGVTYHRLFRRA